MESTRTLLITLVRQGLLTPQQGNELARETHNEVTLVSALVQRGWLTRFQGERLSQGKVHDLILGSYCLLDLLGQGGMGEVFKARHQLMNRIVAIKFVRHDLIASVELLRRFRREIEAIAKLNHPNIVSAYDAERVGDAHFLVLEYCEGRTLNRLLCESKVLPVGQVCEWGRQTALGLQHAHERGLVHRDVKPSNLMLVGGVVKILDLGLVALRVGGAEAEATQFTVSGVVLGTPDYMAPEQARSSKKADFRADLYSLGCTLYHLLAGRVPFPGGTLTDKLLHHQMDQPTPLLQLRPDLGDAAEVIHTLMAKNPSDRYRSALEVARALAPFARREEGSLRGSFVAPETDWPDDSAQRVTGAASTVPPQPITTSETPKRTRPPSRRSTGGAIPPPPPPVPIRPATPTSSHEPADATAPPRPSRRQSPSRRLLTRWLWLFGAVFALFVVGVSFAVWNLTAKDDEKPVKPANVAPAPDTWVEWYAIPVEGMVRIQRLTFSPNSDLLAIGASNTAGDSGKLPTEGRAIVWDIGGRKQRWEAKHESTVFQVKFSPSGKQLATAVGDSVGDKGEIRIWDVEKGSEEIVLSGHKGGTFALAWQPQPSRLLSGGKDGYLRVWRPSSAKPDLELPSQSVIWSLACSADSTRIATGDANSEIVLREWPSLNLVDRWKPDRGIITSLAFSPTDPVLAAAVSLEKKNEGGVTELRLWNVRTGAKRQFCDTLESHFQVHFSPDGRRLLVTYPSLALGWYSLDPDRLELQRLPFSPQNIPFVALSPDGRYLATAGRDEHGKTQVRLWRASRP